MAKPHQNIILYPNAKPLHFISAANIETRGGHFLILHQVKKREIWTIIRGEAGYIYLQVKPVRTLAVRERCDEGTKGETSLGHLTPGTLLCAFGTVLTVSVPVHKVE